MDNPNLATQAASTPLRLSAAGQKRVHVLIGRYPHKVAALIPVLHIIQDEFGYLSEAAMDLVAGLLETTSAHVFGTAKFYDMFRFSPPAKHQLIVCRNLSCTLCGSEQLTTALRQKLQGNNNVEIVEFECLAACDKAPVILLDGKLHTQVTAENLPKELKKILEHG